MTFVKPRAHRAACELFFNFLVNLIDISGEIPFHAGAAPRVKKRRKYHRRNGNLVNAIPVVSDTKPWQLIECISQNQIPPSSGHL